MTQRIQAFEFTNLSSECDMRLIVQVHNRNAESSTLRLKAIVGPEGPQQMTKIVTQPEEDGWFSLHIAAVAWRHRLSVVGLQVELRGGSSAAFEITASLHRDEKFYNSTVVQAYYCFQKLMRDTEDPGVVSREDRAASVMQDTQSLTYGEISFLSFSSVLDLVNVVPGESFCDLGSGAGKAVLAARMLQPFSKCDGVELLRGLHRMSELALEKAEQTGNEWCPASFVHASLLTYDWSGYDVVYAASTCFSDELLDSITKLLPLLKPGSRFITMRYVISTCCEASAKGVFPMSWGDDIEVYVFTRT